MTPRFSYWSGRLIQGVGKIGEGRLEILNLRLDQGGGS